MRMLSLLFDRFTIALLIVVALSTLLPCTGQTAVVFEWVTDLAIAALFFLHGARLSRAAIINGMGHWRLHAVVFACTFVLFPVIGLVAEPLFKWALGASLTVGMLYLCALPSTVQSAIAFTSMGRGNIPAAVCAASASSLIGIFVTPILVGFMLETDGAAEAGGTLEAIGRIMLQLLVPFVLGHLLRPWIAGFVERHNNVLKYVDQGSILLVVYTAFSSAVVEGLWKIVPLQSLLILTVICCVLLAVVLVFTTWASRRMGFSKEDEITIVFCGSKKSLATGAPMAQVLFSTSMVGMAILPLMIFHQIQLMVCAVMAQRYAQREELKHDAETTESGTPTKV